MWGIYNARIRGSSNSVIELTENNKPFGYIVKNGWADYQFAPTAERISAEQLTFAQEIIQGEEMEDRLERVSCSLPLWEEY